RDRLLEDLLEGDPEALEAFQRLRTHWNATTSAAVMTALTVATGSNTFQPKRISWSYRRRGSVVRSQMKTKRTPIVLSRNQIGPMSHGPCQPSKKSVTIKPESVIRLMYSAIWNRPQRIPEYSVW